jgi:hypothetical protein
VQLFVQGFCRLGKQKLGGIKGEFGIGTSLPDKLPLPLSTFGTLRACACDGHVVLLCAWVKINGVLRQ